MITERAQLQALMQICEQRDESTCTRDIRAKYPSANEVYMEAGCVNNLPDCKNYAKSVCSVTSERAH